MPNYKYTVDIKNKAFAKVMKSNSISKNVCSFESELHLEL